jgi:hypothetical protein
MKINVYKYNSMFSEMLQREDGESPPLILVFCLDGSPNDIRNSAGSGFSRTFGEVTKISSHESIDDVWAEYGDIIENHKSVRKTWDRFIEEVL